MVGNQLVGFRHKSVNTMHKSFNDAYFNCQCLTVTSALVFNCQSLSIVRLALVFVVTSLIVTLDRPSLYSDCTHRHTHSHRACLSVFVLRLTRLMSPNGPIGPMAR